MLIRNTEQQFGLVAKLLHWSIALLIIGLIWLGWYMVDLTYYDVWYNDSLVTHRALGMVVLALALFKTVWMVGSPAPQPLASLKQWERMSSHGMHWLLLVSMFLLPLTGYLISTSEGAAVPIFNWFDIPAVIKVDETVRDIIIEIHYYAAYAVLVMVCIHAAAALKHQFIARDGTLKRML